MNPTHIRHLVAPGALFASMPPSIAAAKRLQIASPNPVPPRVRVVEVSA